MDSTARDSQRIKQVSVYLAPGCMGCERACELVEELRSARVFDTSVRVIDLSADSSELPVDLIAIPSWYVNGKLISLGNPSIEQLCEALLEDPVDQS